MQTESELEYGRLASQDQRLKDLREYIEKQISYYENAFAETDEPDAESFCTGALDTLKDILYRL